MIQLIGLKSDVSVDVREKLSIPANDRTCLEALLGVASETVVISTCNRTEIYFNSDVDDDSMVKKIFDVLGWNLKYACNIFHVCGRSVSKHLCEVACGFHSKILGEDQILGQVKDAYYFALENKAVKCELLKLFEIAITCGKRFKLETKMYKIPVSSSSIVVNKSKSLGIRRFMVLGYGNVGKLVCKYILGSQFDRLYIAVRNPKKVDLADEKVEVVPFSEKNKHYTDVECIISCTSSKEPVIKKRDLPDRKLLIFDLAVPRDVDYDVHSLKDVRIYNIDEISHIDDENKIKRKEHMEKFRFIIDHYINEFSDWMSIREIAPFIKRLKLSGEKVCDRRYNTFIHKENSKEHEKLAKVLIKSTSDAYINRAIELLKEEKLKGRADECLRVIEKIFLNQA